MARSSGNTSASDTPSGRPEIVIVAAMTSRRVIGRQGQLPWHISGELRKFRELTTGHAVIMGRKTFDSIGRPLPERRNIVISRTLPETAGIEVCRSFAKAMEKVAGEERAYIIGGGVVFGRSLSVADAMVISWIKEDYEGETLFPEFDPEEWRVEKTEDHAAFTRTWYRRRR